MKAIYRARKVLEETEYALEITNARIADIATDHMRSQEAMNTQEAWELRGKKEVLDHIKTYFTNNNIFTFSTK